MAVLGGPKVGKTASIQQFVHGIFPPSAVNANAGSSAPLYISENAVEVGDGCLVLFDVTNRESFTDHAVTWLQTAASFSRSIVLVATKMDLVDKDPAARTVPYEEAVALARLFRAMYIETAASSHGSARAPYDALVNLMASSGAVDTDFVTDRNKNSKKCLIC